MSAIQSLNIPSSIEGRSLRGEQRAELRERLLRRFDTQGGAGGVQREFSATLQNLPRVGSDRIGAMLTRLDTNGDGQVNRAELEALAARRGGLLGLLMGQDRAQQAAGFQHAATRYADAARRG